MEENQIIWWWNETRACEEDEEDFFIFQKNEETGDEMEVRRIRKKSENIEYKKSEIIKKIKKEADNIRVLMVADASSEERDGWGIKVKIAEKILLGTATEYEKKAMQIEASYRGEKSEDLAKKIIAKNEKYAIGVAFIDGFSRLAEIAIKKCKTKEELEIEVENLLIMKAELLKNIL